MFVSPDRKWGGRMSICEYCHGAGKIKTIKLISAEQGFDCVEEVCTKCNGSGEYEQTNFEFIQSCTMEEMAELISREVQEQIALYKHYKTPKRYSKISYIQWLKEKHKEE